MTLPDNIDSMTKEALFQELVKACNLYDETMAEYHALLKARKALRENYQQELQQHTISQAKLDQLISEQNSILAEKEAEYECLLAKKQAKHDRLLAEKQAKLEALKKGVLKKSVKIHT